MDLRVKKTLTNIKEAFFVLKKKKSVEKITIKELSETAMINKATFYLHFKDIFDLSEKMQEEIIEEIVEKSVTDDFSNTKESYIRFTKNLITSAEERRERIKVLFSDNDTFVNKLNTKIQRNILMFLPEYRNNPQIELMMSYMVYGAYNASLGLYNCTQEEKIDFICKISEKVLETYHFSP